ncbi:MAG: UDP-glucose 4-epimerase [Hyphomonadaceae bacterium]|nr:UDP-glucose 4-epimerase [Hyphomonadaceae bacterium]
MDTIVVAGGAGYIGSHFCHLAAERGFAPVVVDRIGPGTDRVEAYRRAVGGRFALEVCDIGDEARVGALIARHRPIAAVCFAALIEVGESVANPGLYWDSNYLRAARFFRALAVGGVRHLVFSSTAAVYGSATGAVSLAEGHRLDPASPYGLTKLACELTLQGASAAHNVAPGVQLDHASSDWPPPPSIAAAGPAAFAPPSSLIFRYFNAAGAHPAAGLGEVHDPESHLIPRAIATLRRASPAGEGEAVLTINGEDYATPDGTCMRDYVHVLDLAEAHVAGLEYLLAGGGNDVVNLGSGSGYSIRQVVAAIETVTGQPVPVRIGPRRAGDPAHLVADITKAQRVLGWRPRRGLADIIASAVDFHRHHDGPGA